MMSSGPGRAGAVPVATTEALSQDRLRSVAKAARLYHSHDVRQAEIDHRLRMSQSKVSRLLGQAEDLGVVRTAVVAPPTSTSSWRRSCTYGLDQAHVVDIVSDVEHEVTHKLG